ncbi:hypothetical protein G7062_10825 [Erysipelothrix sp. HDW6C]|uniref:hypothetical protein n=1 Tax=Erysipelothrix sp. HDW6C TaxID=2714930 RepID=UPI00140E231D|nr:hypothetical protein [Erysipelothrix sp. HDW6C]QIK70756.1 hypothetical protein G7062_10825 [Erysipelothrix sp. HDW6C]
MKNYRALLFAILLLFVLVGCMPSTLPVDPKPAGFFSGLWHGWIAPVSLIVSFFNNNVCIYQSFNTGFPYDLGFYIAIISGFGSIAFRRRK